MKDFNEMTASEMDAYLRKMKQEQQAALRTIIAADRAAQQAARDNRPLTPVELLQSHFGARFDLLDLYLQGRKDRRYTVVANSIDDGSERWWMMTRHPLVQYFLRLGVDEDMVARLIYEIYSISREGEDGVLFWRCVPDTRNPRNWRGIPVAATGFTFGDDLTIVGCRRDWCDDCRLFASGTAFFGGHLLGDDRLKRWKVGIVQDEHCALLATVAKQSALLATEEKKSALLATEEKKPDILWLAVGHDVDLTADHWQLLAGRDVVLFPDDMAVEAWKRLAAAAPRTDVSPLFVDNDAKEFLTSAIINNKK